MGKILHFNFKSTLIKIEEYKICKDEEIIYSIFAELLLNDKIEVKRYSVKVYNHNITDENEEIYYGTLNECRKEIKRIIDLYYENMEIKGMEEFE